MGWDGLGWDQMRWRAVEAAPVLEQHRARVRHARRRLSADASLRTRTSHNAARGAVRVAGVNHRHGVNLVVVAGWRPAVVGVVVAEEAEEVCDLAVAAFGGKYLSLSYSPPCPPHL